MDPELKVCQSLRKFEIKEKIVTGVSAGLRPVLQTVKHNADFYCPQV
jgi:hypothetical protein